MAYTYGTSEPAAARLEAIAKFFNPLSAGFVRDFAPNPVRKVLDLGCGPGFTTSMLSEATGCPVVCGLDSSPDFLAMARERFPHCEFLEHDVTAVPFPVTADLIYARFLLSHLKQPVRLVNEWTTQLNEEGRLILEETGNIETDVQVFKDYLAVSAMMIEKQGAKLHIGDTLGSGSYDAQVVFNKSLRLPVADGQAATWFLPNTLTLWEQNQKVLDALSASERRKISGELSRIMNSQSKESNITWNIRRVVLSRP